MRRLLIVVGLCLLPSTSEAQMIPRIISRATRVLFGGGEPSRTPVYQQRSADDVFSQSNEEPVPRFKKQFLQRADVTSGWVGSLGNDIHQSWVRTSLAAGFPIKGDIDNAVGFIPSFRADFLSARPEFDVPDELYEVGLGFLWRKKINDRWVFLGQVQPSIRSDFTTSDSALRIFGMAIWTYQYTPDELAISMGAVALGRNDLPLLPALGLTWTPDRYTKVELGLPRSRVAHRLAKDGTRSETWAYVSGAIGGNTWAVTQPSGLQDELSLRSLRAMFGVEKITNGGGGWFAEVGYAFFRRLEFESTEIEQDLSDGISMQVGLAW